ncbi:DUF2393 family protein [Sulfurospirillum sp. T05]|uniref:DUF2393 family protein n=1 Tax=Sulfurospirillum tamanense TaxID=2813362 RepID=A0ABS2WR40_9BACT|nr:DUF2393 family protein [Sulfurospirillum tamanensis]MBN2963990.1 DUF2393 family protein [Sulfurospirillum tamanensis]
MGYFTILHIIALLFLLGVFVLLVLLTRREKRPKVFWAMIFSNTLVTLMLMVFSMLVLDKYTKSAVIENLTQKRVLISEQITFSGQIRNIGNFTIGKCFFEVKLVNNPISAGGLSGSQVFKPTTGLSFGTKKDEKASTVTQTFTIATNLRPEELRNFSVSMPYPSHFQRTTTFQKLHCR